MSINCLAYILSRNMNPIATQQDALDNALVPSKKRLKIERCNARIAFSKPQKEETYQVTLEALKLSPCYPAFVITAEVPEIYMHQFWTTIKKIRDSDAYNFKLEKKKNLAILADVICYLQLIKCTSLGEHLLQSSIDFMYQADNRDISSARKEHMPYLRFTKVIINHFISKDKTISMRNRINLHTIRDDSLLGTLKFVSKTQDYQQYGALIPDDMINQDIKDSNAYKTYYDFATGKVPPRKAGKYKKVTSPPIKLSLVKEAKPVKKGKRVKRHAKKSATAPTVGVILRGKVPAKGDRSKGIEILSDVALSEAGDGTHLESGVPDEKQRKTSGTDKGTGTKLRVPNVPTYDFESENESWGDNEDDNDDDSDDNSKGDDDKADSDDDGNFDADDKQRTDSDDADDENPSFTLKDYDEEEHDDEYELYDDNENVFKEEDDDDMYKDVDMRSLGIEHEKERQGDEEMADADQNVSQELPYEQVVEDAHVTLTASQKTDDSKQSSFVSSDFASKFLILDNVPPAFDEVASMMNVKNRQENQALKHPLFSLVSTLETELSQLKQADLSAQVLESVKSQLLTMVDELLISDFATLVIQSTITESLENVVLAKSSSQSQSTYEAATSLTEFELKKILIDKLEKCKSYRAAEEHRNLYDALIKSFQLDKDLFDSYGKAYSLKRSRDDKDKDEYPPARSDQGLKKKKINKDAEPPKGSKSKESKTNTELPQDQGGDTEERPNVEATPKGDWFKKPERPPTPDPEWSATKSVDSRPPQQWLSKIAQAKKPPFTFDELLSTHIDFSAYVMHNLKIDNLTQEILVGPAFNLLKGTCKSFLKLEYHFEECYKAVMDQLDWNNPEGHEYPLDLRKPLPLIEAQGHQVVPADYFFNNDLEYLKGGSSSRKYTTSTTKTKAARYDNIEGIEDMVSNNRESKHDVFSRKRIIAVTHVKVMKWYGYGYLEEINVRREDQSLYKFKEGDFPRLNLRDIEDLLLLLVQKKLSNLEQDVIFDLNVALRMFTRCIVILKRVKDLQLGVESYQKKLNITKPETFRSGISKLTPYTTYKNPQGIIYHDKFKRNRLMRSDKLYKFCDCTLTSIRRVLHDITNNLRMDYLPKRKWSNLDKTRSRIMIKAIDQ
ncbi:hypothetical protein Tco_0321685 [Tanacetum coccineum]